MARYFNKTNGPLPLTLANGEVVLLPPKRYMDLTPEQDGSSAVVRAIAKKFLVRIASPEEAPKAPETPTAKKEETPKKVEVPLPATTAVGPAVDAAAEPASSAGTPTGVEGVFRRRRHHG